MWPTSTKQSFTLRYPIAPGFQSLKRDVAYFHLS